MGPRSFQTTFSKTYWSIITRTYHQTCKRKSRIMGRPLILFLTIFQSTDTFTAHLIGPRTYFSRRFITAMYIEHQFIFCCFFQASLIQINKFFRFVGKGIQLQADNTQTMTSLKQCFALLRITNVTSMTP